MKNGYKGTYLSDEWRRRPLFIQSFAPTSLIYSSSLTNSPLILLIDDLTLPTQDTNQVVYHFCLHVTCLKTSTQVALSPRDENDIDSEVFWFPMLIIAMNVL